MKTALLRSSIKQGIQDSENWQARFDPSWYLMTLVADSTIDQHSQQRPTFYYDPTEKLKAIREATRLADACQMQHSMFIDSRSIEGFKQSLSWNTTYVSHMRDGQAVLLDTITYLPDFIMSIATTHVHDLARVLSNADPEVFGLLACHGAVKIADEQAGVLQFQFVFAGPPGLFIPRTL